MVCTEESIQCQAMTEEEKKTAGPELPNKAGSQPCLLALHLLATANRNPVN